MPRSQTGVMWSAALAILTQNERLHPEQSWPAESGWEPATDVLETETGLLIVVALAGVRREDMEIVVSPGQLLVRGTRRWPNLQRPARVHRIELPHGRFERRLPLPPGAYQMLGQEHVDGCLLLTLRRLD
jgi:HSP20 family protein